MKGRSKKKEGKIESEGYLHFTDSIKLLNLEHEIQRNQLSK